jgi:hypothetical protein
MLQRTGVPTAAAELPLSRMRAKVDHFCSEPEALRKSDILAFRAVLASEKAEERAPADLNCPHQCFQGEGKA